MKYNSIQQNVTEVMNISFITKSGILRWSQITHLDA